MNSVKMLVFCTVVYFVVVGISFCQDLKQIEQDHKNFIYPVVRVRTKNAGGSGTIIRSEKEDQDNFCNYILTNNHVIESAIKYEKEYSTLTKQYEDIEKLETVNVEIFRYMNISKLMDRATYDATILTYDKSKDIALLMFRTPFRVEHIAKMPVKNKTYYILQRVCYCGSALGHKPITTTGEIISIDEQIDEQQYFMSNASSIFGNSGGAAFLMDTGELVGIPSRIDVARSGFSDQAVPHLNYFIPIDIVYETLNKNGG